MSPVKQLLTCMVRVREHLVYVRIVIADPVVVETENGMRIARSGSYWQRDTTPDVHATRV